MREFDKERACLREQFNEVAAKIGESETLA